MSLCDDPGRTSRRDANLFDATFQLVTATDFVVSTGPYEVDDTRREGSASIIGGSLVTSGPVPGALTYGTPQEVLADGSSAAEGHG
jgi:hypothetical protein